MFFTTQHQGGATIFLWCALLSLQSCQTQLNVTGEETTPTGVSRETETQQGDTSNTQAVAQPASLPSLRATGNPTQRGALSPPASPVRQTQGDTPPPAKRQRTAEDIPTTPTTAPESLVDAKLPQEALISNAGEYKEPNYVIRHQETEELQDALEQHSVCVLHGHGGSGKSTLAYHYAYTAAQSAKQQIVWLVPSDSPDKIQAAFQNLAQKLDIDYKAIEPWKSCLHRYRQELGRAIYNAVETNGQCLHLILDNAGADVGTLVEDLISQRSIRSTKIIITTRDPIAFAGYEKVALSDFLLEEGVTYAKQRLRAMPGRFAKSNTRILTAGARQLVYLVGRTPLKLDLAMSFLQQNKPQTITHYTDRLQTYRESSDALQRPGAIPDVDMGLATLDKLSQQVMRYSTSLDADFIPLSLLGALLEEPEDKLREILKPLERLSLVTVIAGNMGIRIRQSVQDSCQTYHKWHVEADLSEEALLNRLVEVLYKVMPWVEALPDARWETSRLYAPHVSRVLSKAESVLGEHPAIAFLLEFMGNYQKEVAHDYQQGLTYCERALVMRQKLYGDSPHPDIARSLNSVGVAYETLGEVQKERIYFEQASTMYQALYGEMPHSSMATSLNNVGIAYEKLGEAQKALIYHEKALAMLRDLYGEVPHPDIAASLNNVGAVYQALGEAQKALMHQKKALAMLQYLYGEVSHPDIARSLNGIGVAYENLDDMQKGLTYLEQASTMHQELYGEVPHPDVARSLSNISATYEMLGETQKALAYREKAFAVLQDLYLGSSYPDITIAKSLDSVGMAYERLGDIQKGLTCQEQALAIRQKFYGEKPHPDVASSLSNAGIAHQKLGDVQRGLAYQERALAIRQKFYGEKPHPDVAKSLNNVGAAYEALGEIKKGLTYFGQALMMYQKLHGEEPHLDTATSLNNLGKVYQMLGNMQTALTYLEHALKMRQKLYGDEPNPDVARSLSNVGWAYQMLEETQKSLPYQEKALTMCQQLYGEKIHPDMATALNNIGVAYETLGELQKGLKYQEQALAMHQKLYGKKLHPNIANSLNNVGVAYETLGEVQKGIAYQEQALTIRRRFYEEKPHPDVANSLNNVGMAYQKVGDKQKAKQYFEEGLAFSKKLDSTVAASYAQAFMQKLASLHDSPPSRPG